MQGNEVEYPKRRRREGGLAVITRGGGREGIEKKSNQREEDENEQYGWVPQISGEIFFKISRAAG